jgi:D-alanyl-D-alanine carboxypeptidase
VRIRGYVAVAAALALAACSHGSGAAPLPSTSAPAPSGSSAPSPSAPAEPTPTQSADPPAPTSADAVIKPIGAQQWARIVAAGVWRKGCPVGRDGLRRIEVNHHDFDGGVQRGVLVVNADVAGSTARIFTQLFDAGFPIHTMRPMEEYGGDDDLAMFGDVTSGFNCRKPAQANAPPTLSPHANGRAIDVNPYENPWVDPRCDCWKPSRTFAVKPRTGQGVISRGSVAWTAFTNEGWTWQDIKTPDYMHFDTGYPSVGPPSATPAPSTPSG